MLKLIFFLGLIYFVHSKIYFKESFDDSWESRWVQSEGKKSEGTAGALVRSAGKFFKDAEGDAGVMTSEDARFYQYAAEFPSFSNAGKDLVVHYTVKYEKAPDCGGAYLKLGPPGLDRSQFDGETAYNVMFGPDKCGATQRTHAILSHGEHNHLVKTDVPPQTEVGITHSYTFVLTADQQVKILIDGEEKLSQAVADAYDIVEPEFIPDMSVEKPSQEEHDEREYIDDPEDAPPANPEPEFIPEADAEKPSDWDEELDGEWEAPMVPNPDYKPWSPKQIKNPNYAGKWERPQMKNPAYDPDVLEKVGKYEFGWVGIEDWQVASGSIFGRIVIADSLADVQPQIDYVVKELQVEEKSQKAAADAKAAEEAEAARKAAEANAGDDDEDDDDNEDEL